MNRRAHNHRMQFGLSTVFFAVTVAGIVLAALRLLDEGVLGLFATTYLPVVMVLSLGHIWWRLRRRTVAPARGNRPTAGGR